MSDKPDQPPLGERAKDFFLARQPILNRDQSLVAYELLFRRAETAAADVIDDLSATASVISHASELGMNNVVGSSLGFVNIDAAVLMSDFVQFLPRDKVVLEILETVKVDDAILKRVSALKQAGYIFALDDVIKDTQDVRQLLPLVDIVKIDINGMQPADIARLSQQFKSAHKKLLAEKVESIDQVKLCLDLGFDYFQGYYFAKPAVLSGKKLPPSQLALICLMGLLNSDAENVEIERAVKQDAALGLNLLRMANSPALGSGSRISTLGQAMMLLGRQQLQRWLQILMYSEPGRKPGAVSPLLNMATTRGKLLELVAQKIRPGNRQSADIAFTVGIMSLVDALFGIPMREILMQMPVSQPVSDALLSRNGLYGDMLRFAEQLERMDESPAGLRASIERLGLTHNDLQQLQLAAYDWSDQVSRHT
jgi:EAL and modified HD-GYP domain-containing signal transduction protein